MAQKAAKKPFFGGFYEGPDRPKAEPGRSKEKVDRSKEEIDRLKEDLYQQMRQHARCLKIRSRK